jgi:uncharacterized protein YkwD
MRRLSLFAASAGLLAATLLPSTGAPLTSVVHADDDQTAAAVDASPLAPVSDEQVLLDLTNADRAAAGLAPLSFDVATLPVARTRAVAQDDQPVLNHMGADGQLAFAELLDTDGLAYTAAGENLARGTGSGQGFVADLNAALMQSPPHRENILDPNYTSLSVGEAQDASGRTTFAEIFRGVPDSGF